MNTDGLNDDVHHYLEHDSLSVEPVEHANPCRHPAVYAVEETRTLECQFCGATVDPFDFIYERSVSGKKTQMELEYIKQRHQRLAKRTEELEDEETAIKKRIRTARRNLKDVEDNTTRIVLEQQDTEKYLKELDTRVKKASATALEYEKKSREAKQRYDHLMEKTEIAEMAKELANEESRARA